VNHTSINKVSARRFSGAGEYRKMHYSSIPLKAESRFEFPFDGHKIKGRIDRLERTPSGDLEVIDWKTGKSIPTRKEVDEHLQLHLYGFAIEAKHGKLPRTASLLYLEKNKLMTISFDKQRMDAFKVRLRQDIDNIMNEEFEPTPTYQTCRFCDYQSICEVGMTTK
jgi:DNA helicase-2/ATP-dependent DNA helicase PcrA